jgi:AcrR family transcriptional regulator
MVPMSVRREPQSFESILEVATDLFYRDGYVSTSMQDIADTVGIHKSSLYHHTRSKDDLLHAICQRSLDELNASLERARTGESSARGRVTAAIRGAVRAALEDPRSTSIIVRLEGKGAVHERIAERRRDYERGLAALVADAQRSGAVRSEVDAALLSRLILGMINWIVQWFDSEVGPYSAQSVEDAVLAMVTKGIFPG